MLAPVTRSSSLKYLPFPTRSQTLWMSIFPGSGASLGTFDPPWRHPTTGHPCRDPRLSPKEGGFLPSSPCVPNGGSLRHNPEPKPDWCFCSHALLKMLFFVDLLKISTLWKSLLFFKSFPAGTRYFPCAFFPSTVPGFFQASSALYQLNLLFFLSWPFISYRARPLLCFPRIVFWTQSSRVFSYGISHDGRYETIHSGSVQSKPLFRQILLSWKIPLRGLLPSVLHLLESGLVPSLSCPAVLSSVPLVLCFPSETKFHECLRCSLRQRYFLGHKVHEFFFFFLVFHTDLSSLSLSKKFQLTYVFLIRG